MDRRPDGIIYFFRGPKLDEKQLHQPPDEMPPDTLISAEQNAKMFDAIAGRYDLMNRLISLGLDQRWRKRGIAALGLRNAGVYLDVGCGTADLGVSICQRRADVAVVGVDPALEMLRVGQRKLQRSALSPRVMLSCGDAQRLPFAEKRFDGVITAFCIRNVTRRKVALDEMLRVLKPGGELVILELTTPAHPFVAWGHRLFSVTLIPFAARLLSMNSAYQYLNDSVRAFPPPAEFTELLRAAGFQNCRSEALSLGTVTLFLRGKSLRFTSGGLQL